jgi:hypothetical protein
VVIRTPGISEEWIIRRREEDYDDNDSYKDDDEEEEDDDNETLNQCYYHNLQSSYLFSGIIPLECCLTCTAVPKACRGL